MHTEQNPQDATASLDQAVSENETLAAELDQLRATIVAVREESLRERAELDNQRKRLVRDVDQARLFANERLLSQLLPVFDSLDAGIAAAAGATGPLKDGLDLTLKQLLKVANDNGMRMLDPVGETFNPEYHQAVSQAPAGKAAPGSVLQVFQKGYVLNDRLLRPALVVVASSD
ncbi:nucleotide exchange factor GrpE [Arenimonas sp.]|uniref:nucleotide exchange factor GrpE n=1 Tax=Arenimonas sp. TaxID=1872635 RepID=UPI0039E45ADB